MTKRKHVDFSVKNPVNICAYLNDSLEYGHIPFFLIALRNVVEAYGGVRKLSKETKLDRVHLYRMLSEKGNPELSNLRKILDKLGFRLQLEIRK